MLRSAIILFSLLTVPLRANLGETTEQCVARYGRPAGYSEANAKNPFGTVVFVASNYTLVIFVFQNKEVGARVSKTDKSAFTSAELQTIMGADSGGSPWITAASDDPTCLRWNRSDKATVYYDKDSHVVIFTSEAMARAVHAVPKTTTPSSPAPAAPAQAAN